MEASGEIHSFINVAAEDNTMGATSNTCVTQTEVIQPPSQPNTFTLSGRRRRPDKPLSQARVPPPPCGPGSHRARLEWLQRRRCTGVWAACDACDKFRYLQHVHDPLQLPERWYCRMNPDSRYARCAEPEVALSVAEEEDLVHSTYGAGSVVWARMRGFPAWPALVDDDPDTEQFYWLDGFSDIPTFYHVVFFDSPGRQTERAWIETSRLSRYDSAGAGALGRRAGGRGQFAARLRLARREADAALALPVPERLRRCSFLARYRGDINPPARFHAHQLKQFGDFSDKESDADNQSCEMNLEETTRSPLDTDLPPHSTEGGVGTSEDFPMSASQAA